ncbi:MAG TPA: DUF3108 domain-containing protein [Pyrinomonadaceae bacterium]|nr:DUF3108 domain-containing protein [Pyrinomonadaceae bacterium]
MKNSLFISLTIGVLGFIAAVFAQEVPKATSSPITAPTTTTTSTVTGASFRIGERLSYSVSFGKITDAAYAEIFIASRGKLSGKDAVELHGKFKTTNLVSAFYLLDELRMSYASAETGLPLYTKVVSNEGIQPKEAAKNFLENPTAYHDLLTAIYQARSLGGSGTVSFQENDRVYNAVFQPNGGMEKVKTDAGEFETSISTVQSSFLDEAGLRDLRINFSNDEAHLPVLIRFKTQRGEFRAALASVQTILPQTESQVEPTPVLTATTPTPLPIITPRPTPAATPYIENQPLPVELPFKLGETLNFRVTTQNQNIGTVTLQAKERKLLPSRSGLGVDSLLLTATVSANGQQRGILNVGDSVKSHVNPITLAPMNVDFKLTGSLSAYNQAVQFEQAGGFALDSTGNRVEMPVGTHSLLSLAYAIRSFSLWQSKNRENPVNDTRVAIFVGDKPYVLILRPLTVEIIEFQGRRFPAQVVAIVSADQSLSQINQLNLKIWLSVDEKRLPLRFVVGAYQADLQSVTQNPVK